MCCGCWSCIIFILTIILIACSLETIDSTEMGLAYNTPQCILDTEVQTEGLKGKAPFGEFILWPKAPPRRFIGPPQPTVFTRMRLPAFIGSF